MPWFKSSMVQTFKLSNFRVTLYGMIRHCHHSEIDFLKWDACIARSSPGLPYAYSWYLDIISPGWDGLMADNYEAVMPLPFKQKWFINYVHKPYFAQQLGIFSPETLTAKQMEEFIRNIPSRFQYIHTNLNEANIMGDCHTRIINSNHLIRLDRDYGEIFKNYSRNCRRNIKKARESDLSINNNVGIPVFVKFVFDNLEQKIGRLGRQQIHMLEIVINISQQKKMGEIFGVFTKQQELCAAGFFIQTPERYVFSVCASTKQGKQQNAMYLLVDDRIKKSAGDKKWFDFSGSNIPGIAYFNQSFGAKALDYPTLHLNRLPFPLRLLKNR